MFSPDLAVSGETVFVGKGQSILALALDTGELIWEVPFAPYGGAPFVHWVPMVSSGRVVVNSAAETLCFDVKTGALCWRLPYVGIRTVYFGRVYIATNAQYAIVDLESGETLSREPAYDGIRSKWKIKDAFEFGTSLLVTESHVFVGDTRGRMYGMVRDTWEPVWHHRPKERGSYFNAELAVGGGRLYARTFSPTPQVPQVLHCYEQADLGDPVAVDSPEEPVAELPPARRSKASKRHRP